MKNKIFAIGLSAAVLLASCKKEENKIYFEGGTAPVLTASSTSPMVLTTGNAANQAIKFSWTNPDYHFNTGISSQDVNYVLQVDTTGANFTNPNIQEVSIPRELAVNYTVKDLNQILTKLNVQENMQHAIEFRIKSSIGNAVPLYSNVVKINITPYLDVAVPIPPTGELYITGNAVASDWTNTPPAATQKFTKLAANATLFEITVALIAGSDKQYKFLSTQGAWQPQYGGSSATGGDMGFNMGLPGQSDPPGIPAPSVSGNYKITVNFKTGKYSVAKL